MLQTRQSDYQSDLGAVWSPLHPTEEQVYRAQVYVYR